MRNPLTFRIESSLGALFLVMFTIFAMTLMFASLKDLDSELALSGVSMENQSGIPPAERRQIKAWVEEAGIILPPGKGYAYLIEKYPSRPWRY